MFHWSTQKQSKYKHKFKTNFFISKPTKITWGFLEDGSKVRVAKKSGAIIPKPDRNDLKYVNRTKDKEQGDLDTNPEDVLEKTYTGEDFVKVYAEFQEYIRQKEEKESQLIFKNWIKYMDE